MRLRLTSSALALMVLTSPALADVSPDEVWGNWLEYFETSGYKVSEGSRDSASGKLTLRDVRFRTGDDQYEVEFTVREIAMVALGDGRVRTVYSSEQPIAVSGVNTEDQRFQLDLAMSYPGNEMITSGDVGAMTHDYTLPEFALTFGTLKTEDEETPLPIVLKVADSSGSFSSIDNDGKITWDNTHKSGMIDFQAEFTNEDEATRFNLSGAIDGVELAGSMEGITRNANMQEELAQALKDGLIMDGTIKFGATDFSFDFDQLQADGAEGEPNSGKGTGSVGPGDLTFGLSRDGVVYQGNNGPLALDLALSSVPFPISYGTDSSSFDLQMPVTAGDEAQSFKLAYSVAGVTLSDGVWDMFDPGKQLPRDPASLDIDISGAVKVIRDLFDPATFAPSATDENEDLSNGAESPYEPLGITISQLALQAVGVNISANGELRPSQSGDMAEPVGQISARYEGVNTLLDSLGEMGLVPTDQIAAGRMMLALFARPADGDDVLTTEVEFREDGSIFANGQQVK